MNCPIWGKQELSTEKSEYFKNRKLGGGVDGEEEEEKGEDWEGQKKGGRKPQPVDLLLGWSMG